MVKAEWGTKRACPKCNSRFYDLTKEDPVTCIACGYAWAPEPVLKSKQTMPFEQAKPAAKTEDEVDPADAEADLDLEVAEAEDTEAPDVDLGDDDDLGDVVAKGEDDDI